MSRRGGLDAPEDVREAFEELSELSVELGRPSRVEIERRVEIDESRMFYLGDRSVVRDRRDETWTICLSRRRGQDLVVREPTLDAAAGSAALRMAFEAGIGLRAIFGAALLPADG